MSDVEAGHFESAKTRGDPKRQVLDLDRLVSPPDVSLVGRELELRSLLQCVDRLRSGRGHIVAVVGEAGIGKSRLIREAQSQLRERSVPFFEGDCMPYGQSLFFLPIQQIVRSYFGTKETDSAERCRRKIETALAGVAGFDSRDIELFVALLGHPPSSEAFPSEEAQKRLVRSFLTLTLHASGDKPLVVFIEDLHWIDQSSLECLDFLIENVRATPILICFTAREGFAHGWAGHTYYSQISLAELLDDEIRRLAESVAGFPMPTDLLGLLAEKSRGNPFFVCEVVRQLIDEGVIARQGEGSRLTRSLDEVALPDTIEEAIARRIGTLDERSRALLQKASVIGRSFGIDLLRLMAGGEEAIERSLEVLRRADLIHETPTGGEGESGQRYVFTHGLTHEVAYEGLMHGHRKTFHLQVARTIERLHRESLSEWYEILAHHYLATDETDNALRFLKLSGDKAASLWSAREALDFYGRYLDLYERGPDTAERRRSRFDVHMATGELYLLIGVTREAVGAFESAVECAEWTGESLSLGRALRLLGRAHIRINEYERARELATRARELFEQTGSELDKAMATNDLGVVDWNLGRLDEAHAMFRRYLAAAEQLDDAFHQANACSNIALIHWNQGRLDEAIIYNRRALEIRRQRRDLRGQIISHNNLGIIHEKRGEYADALHCYEETLRLAREIHFAEGLTASACNIGQHYMIMGDLNKARERLEEAHGFAQQEGDRYGHAIVHLVRANLELYGGRFQASLDGFEEAIMLTREARELQREVHGTIEHGATCVDLGNLEQGEALLALAAERIARHGFGDIEPLVLLAQADLALARREQEHALDLSLRAAEAIERHRLLYLRPRVRWLQGEIARRNGRSAEAETHWRKTLATAERNRDCRAEIRALIGLARLRVESDCENLEETETLIARLEHWTKACGWRIWAWWPPALRGRQQYRRGDYAAASVWLTKAVETLEHLASTLDGGEARRNYFAHPDRADVFFDSALTFLMLGREELAQHYLTSLDPELSEVWMSNLSLGEELSAQLAGRFVLEGLTRSIPVLLALLVLPRGDRPLCFAQTAGGPAIELNDPETVRWVEKLCKPVGEATLLTRRELPELTPTLLHITGEIDRSGMRTLAAPVRAHGHELGWLLVLCPRGESEETVKWVHEVREHLSRCADLLYSHLLLLKAKSEPLAPTPIAGTSAFETLVGQSEPLRVCIETTRRAARTNAPVLLLGETGTGKELFARAIHGESDRRDGNFVAINCAAIPETLLTSELFGYEKGAFTGAARCKPGKVEQADNGTLLLDEIGDMPIELQAKVLRFLEDGTFDRVGGRETLYVNVRLVAATNQDLQEAVARGTFRRDLLYRLNVVAIEVPPLRKRLEDLPLLVEHFLELYARRYHSTSAALSSQAMEVLVNYPWPGNVRELEHVIEHALIVAQGPIIEPADLPAYLSQSPRNDSAFADLPLEEAVNRFKRQRIAEALEKARGNQTEAARMLDIHRTHLHRLTRKLEILE